MTKVTTRARYTLEFKQEAMCLVERRNEAAGTERTGSHPKTATAGQIIL